MLKRGVVFLCNGSFHSGDFKSKKNAYTKLQFETGNGHRLYKSVHDGKKKVTHISLTLYTVLSLNQCHKMHFSIRKIQGEYLLPSTLCFNLKYLLI